MKVETFLKSRARPVFMAGLDDTVAETALRFSDLTGDRKYSLAVVCDDENRVVGVVSLGDIAYALGRHKANAAAMRVRDIMSRDVIAAGPGDEVMDVLNTMAERDIRHMPVVEAGKLLGLIARRDALEFLFDENALELQHLRGFVFRSGARY